MMRIEVPLVSLGEEEDAVQGGVISEWLVEEGSALEEGDDLLELTTDKAAFVVPSPRTGLLVEQRVAPGDEVQVGEILGVMEVSD